MKTVKTYLLVPADVSKPIRIVDNSAIHPDDGEKMLKFFQGLVGGTIEAVPVFSKDVGAYCHGEGNIIGLKPNHRFNEWMKCRTYAVLIVGDVLIYGGNDRHGNNRSVPKSVIKYFEDNKPTTLEECFPNGKPADDSFDADLHFTGDLATDNARLASLLKEYGASISMYYFYMPFPGMYSLEVQFFDTATAKHAQAKCRAEYQSWPVADDEVEDD